MAFTGSSLCTSFKKELLEAVHNLKTSGLGGHTFKIALYSSAATLTAATTVYSATNEVSGAGYVAGGMTLTNSGTSTNGTTAYADFATLVTAAMTVTARGALIYNSSAANAAVCVLDFGADKTVTAAAMTIQMPTNDSTNAIVRIL